LAIELLVNVLNAGGILADDERRKVFQRCRYGPGYVLEAGFSPAMQSGLVCLDFHEHPIAQLCVDKRL
jgi:hypothetical protein